MNKLTIAIPTFNRKKSLDLTISNLKKIKATDSERVNIFISDNNSEYPVEEILDKHGLRDIVSYRSNKYNFGLGANIMECFRRSDSEWLWVLGDDDMVTSKAISTVLNLIDQADRHVIGINFSSDHGINQKNILVNNIDTLCKTALFSNLLFISTNIFNKKLLMPYAEYGYRSCFFHMPHSSMLLHSFLKETEHSIWLRQEKIVKANLDYSQLTWSGKEMRKIRKSYSIIFRNFDKETQKKISKFTMKGYGYLSVFVHIISNIKTRLIIHNINKNR